MFHGHFLVVFRRELCLSKLLSVKEGDCAQKKNKGEKLKEEVYL